MTKRGGLAIRKVDAALTSFCQCLKYSPFLSLNGRSEGGQRDQRHFVSTLQYAFVTLEDRVFSVFVKPVMFVLLMDLISLENIHSSC